MERPVSACLWRSTAQFTQVSYETCKGSVFSLVRDTNVEEQAHVVMN